MAVSVQALLTDATRVLSRIYRLGEKSGVAEGYELPSGVRGNDPPPENFLNEYVLRCNLVHFEKYYNVCTDLVGSG